MEVCTEKLLEECSQGCKMAINSINQIQEHIENDRLSDVVSRYKKKHRELEKEAAALLEAEGKAEPSVKTAASAMSWITTNVKLMMDEGSGQIAKLLIDGCNMGVQGITENIHKYKEASKESKSLAQKLVKLEEDMMKDMKEFL